ncbi:hypothetical protein O7606_00720 [Micromonospora sp. WMMD882]|uniref:hypothetical protein n=1 Tax=Micromonospora sp. WMMD882 TaxID=3015151 RepID=UPI00248B7DFF|nr:hypothetical protein [Micromonospora sp. WMMD882]WBB79966.1 hypothetical protein O7606_00720 [Micromonospora sp. WMMD882]
MGGTDPGSAREEAERLVATLLATARLAGAGSSAGSWGPLGEIITGVLGHSRPPGRSAGGGFATGTPECCVCPICRAMVALRDPSPEFAERLATGAGDLAAGVASLLRAFSPEPPPPPPTTSPPGADDQVWREATRTGHDSQPVPERDVWSAATRAEDSATPPAGASSVDVAGPGGVARPAAARPVVPASRPPEGADGDAPGDGA